MVIQKEIIKKIVKIFLIVFLVFAGLILLSFAVLHSNKVQTYLTQKIASRYSEKLDTHITISSVDFGFFNKLVLRDIYIEDQNADTLITISKFSGKLSSLKRKLHLLLLDKIVVESAYFNFYKLDSVKYNFEFLLDALNRKDTTNSEWKLLCNDFTISESFLKFNRGDKEVRKKMIDFDNLEIKNLNIELNDLEFYGDTVLLNIIKLDFKDKSGFILDNLSSEVIYNPGKICLNNLNLRTEETNISSGHFDINISENEEYESWEDKIQFDIQLNSSHLNLSEIGRYFIGEELSDNLIVIAGDMNGSLSSINLTEFTMNFGSNLKSSGNHTIKGLPDFKKAFYDINFNYLSTNISDIKILTDMIIEDSVDFELPGQLSEAGDINFNGLFTGYINDFETRGEFHSNFGNLTTNLEVKRDEESVLSFSGHMSSTEFNLGKLIDDTINVGSISIHSELNGYQKKGESINAFIDGLVDKLIIRGYEYKNLQIYGDLAQKRFDGSFKLNDPNLYLDFLGEIDFTGDKPVFDFNASIENAKPKELNLIKRDKNIDSFDLIVEANFVGLSIDDLIGKLVISNSVFRSGNDEVRINDFSFTSGIENNRSKILLNSDFADGRIIGKYKFKTLVYSLKKYIGNYLPSFAYNESDKPINGDNDFNFNIQFKNTSNISRVFFPALKIQSNSRISGQYNSITSDLNIDCFSPIIIVNGKSLIDFYLNISNENEEFYLKTGSNSLVLNKKMKIENFEINTKALNDSIFFTTNWHNADSVKYTGEISANAGLSLSKDKTRTVVSVEIPESELYYSDTLWRIGESQILIDSSYFGINNFLLYNETQLFNINGAVSENTSDTLFFNFRDLGMSNLNPLFKKNKFTFSGNLNGTAKLFNFYEKALFYSNVDIDQLVLNGEPLGYTSIISEWDPVINLVHFETIAKRGQINTLYFDGYIDPNSRKLDFDIELDKLRLNIFSPFLHTIFSDIRGIGTGKLSLAGDLKDPKLDGMINLQKASFNVDYLKTRYNISHSLINPDYNLEIKDNHFILNDIELIDKDGNKAVTSGSVKTEKFKNIELDLRINTSKFLCLDTKEQDNKDFFGKAYASGDISITGPVTNITFDIKAKTEKDTRFFIPMNSGRSIKENDFITFVSPVEDEEEDELLLHLDSYKVDLSGIQLNFNLEVTPEALVEIWFDSDVGDVITGNGSGNFKLDINTQGEFKMYGGFLIEKGDYQFTLQNIPIRKFKILYGGTINWDGDPESAVIDIDALHRVRTTLYDFLLDETNEDYIKRIPVECHLLMTGNLLSPNIAFDIQLPSTIDDFARSQLENLSEAELHKQVISLLIINRFQPMEGRNSFTDINPATYSGTGLNTGTELLTSLLNNWMAQISNEFDVGINYRTGNVLTNDEMEVALSTQLLDNRMSVNVNGNVDMGGENNPARYNNIVGDIDLEYKMNSKGKFRVKAYSHANENLIYDTAPYTQGIGMFYREEFTSFKELMKKYWEKLFKKSDIK